jgi:hypothetical protein
MPSGKLGRMIAVILIGAAALCANAHTASKAARWLREPAALRWGLLSARYADQGRVVPTTLFLLVYSPLVGRLELSLIPASTPLPDLGESKKTKTLADAYGDAYMADGDVERATRAAGIAAWEIVKANAGVQDVPKKPLLWLNFDFPEAVRPGYLREIKAEILKTAGAPLFWLTFAANAFKLVRSEWTDAGIYDSVLLAQELRRLPADAIGLSQFPAVELIERHIAFVARRTLGGPDAPGPATLEVLNATEISGVALKATKILRLREFDVVHFGNTGVLQDEMRIVDNAGRSESAREILAALGCPAEDVVTEIEEHPRAEITVILGRNFKTCSKF